MSVNTIKQIAPQSGAILNPYNVAMIMRRLVLLLLQLVLVFHCG